MGYQWPACIYICRRVLAYLVFKLFTAITFYRLVCAAGLIFMAKLRGQCAIELRSKIKFAFVYSNYFNL